MERDSKGALQSNFADPLARPAPHSLSKYSPRSSRYGGTPARSAASSQQNLLLRLDIKLDIKKQRSSLKRGGRFWFGLGAVSAKVAHQKIIHHPGHYHRPYFFCPMLQQKIRRNAEVLGIAISSLTQDCHLS